VVVAAQVVVSASVVVVTKVHVAVPGDVVSDVVNSVVVFFAVLLSYQLLSYINVF